MFAFCIPLPIFAEKQGSTVHGFPLYTMALDYKNETQEPPSYTGYHRTGCHIVVCFHHNELEGLERLPSQRRFGIKGHPGRKSKGLSSEKKTWGRGREHTEQMQGTFPLFWCKPFGFWN